MDAFKDRGKGFEAKFKHDEELNFKVMARRNKLLGLWAAEQFNFNQKEADIYAAEVVMADFEPNQDVVRKVLGDFIKQGITLTEADLREEMSRLLTEASIQMTNDV